MLGAGAAGDFATGGSGGGTLGRYNDFGLGITLSGHFDFLTLPCDSDLPYSSGKRTKSPSKLCIKRITKVRIIAAEAHHALVHAVSDCVVRVGV